MRAVGAGGTRFAATTAPRAQLNGVASNADVKDASMSGSACRRSPAVRRSSANARAFARGRTYVSSFSSSRAPWRRAIALASPVALTIHELEPFAAPRTSPGRRTVISGIRGIAACAPAGATAAASAATRAAVQRRRALVTCEERGRRPTGG
jgi:hypothetical protein